MYDTEITVGSTIDIDFVKFGTSAVIDDEIIRVEAVNLDTGVVTIARGCVDTLPAAHDADTVVWFYENTAGSDGREYDDGETVYARYLTITSTQKQPLAEAGENSIVIQQRYPRPYTAGNLKLNTIRYGEIVSFDVTVDLIFTWSHRDRIIQQDVLVAHGDASIGPEAGVTYATKVYDDDGITEIHSESGITGATWTYTAAQALLDHATNNLDFTLKTIRDGLESFQSYSFQIVRTGSYRITEEYEFRITEEGEYRLMD